MFGSRKKLERLQEAIARAKDALAQKQLAAMVPARDQLLRAWVDSPHGELSDLAKQLLDDLDAAPKIADRAVEADVPPCRACGAIELLRSRTAARFEELFIGGAEFRLEVNILVCRACGEVRMVADPARVAATVNLHDEPGFERIVTKRSPQGPFR